MIIALKHEWQLRFLAAQRINGLLCCIVMQMNVVARGAGIVVLVIVSSLSCRQESPDYDKVFPTINGSVGTMIHEHRALLSMWDSIAGADSGSVEITSVLRHHFSEEEKQVFPLLAALPMLAADKMPGDRMNLVSLAEQLKGQLGHLSAEHQLVKSLINQFSWSDEADSARFARFKLALLRHALLEEEILFPAAIVAGDRMRLDAGGN